MINHSGTVVSAIKYRQLVVKRDVYAFMMLLRWLRKCEMHYENTCNNELAKLLKDLSKV